MNNLSFVSIYQQSGLEFTQEVEDAMVEYMAADKKEREAKKMGSAHLPYNLEMFELTEQQVDERFKEYRKTRGYKTVQDDE